MEHDRWSCADAEEVFRHAAALLSPAKGKFLFVSPYPLGDLQEAGWEVSEKLAAVGLAVELQGTVTDRADYILARRQ